MALAAALLAGAVSLHAQVYSPRITKQGQPDVADLKAMTAEIYRQADATTERAKAEAIWRFYLTDGRFVKPGIFVISPDGHMKSLKARCWIPKLLNSYGFGLCYQVAPLLEATYDAGGFRDSRVWFLTVYTVAEVFYDGAYHYFDSEINGQTTPSAVRPSKLRPVASVHQINRTATSS